jgi:hypothetical protein
MTAAEATKKRIDEASRKIRLSLRYVEERSGTFTLFYRNVYTGVQVARSHEGYNHFAKWQVKEGGKVKFNFEIRERELALQTGIIFWQDKLADTLLKRTGQKKG